MEETTIQQAKSKSDRIWKVIDKVAYYMWIVLAVLPAIQHIFYKKPIDIENITLLILCGVMIVCSKVIQILEKLEKNETKI